jgi:hypothetical protein
MVTFACCLATASAQADRDASLTQAFITRLSVLDRQLDGGGTVRTLDLADGALAALIVANDASRASTYLNDEMSVQNGDGTIPWNYRGPAIVDRNAIEFGTEPWGAILLGFSDRLPADVRRSLADHARAALPALYAHVARPSYANIYLMNSVSTELIGEAIGDPTASRRGEEQLRRFIDFTQRSGIAEYDTSSYYPVDIGALEAGYRYTRNPAVRATLATILRYIWTDVAANYILSIERLVGAHSRDYEFTGQEAGPMDAYAFAAGWGNHFRSVDLLSIYLMTEREPGGYVPDAAIAAIASEPRRIVEQRWGESPSAWRYTYVTNAYAIGCANGSYGNQDKLVAVDLVDGTRDLQIVPVVSRPGEDPYGKEEQTEAKSGHLKPFHDLIAPRVVQDRNVLFATYDVPAGDTFSLLMPQEASVEQQGSRATVVLHGSSASAKVVVTAESASGSLVRDGSDFGEMRYAIVAATPLHVTVSAVAGRPEQLQPVQSAAEVQFQEPTWPLAINGKPIDI